MLNSSGSTFIIISVVLLWYTRLIIHIHCWSQSTKMPKEEAKVVVAKSAAELQKIRLEKLMSNPVCKCSEHLCYFDEIGAFSELHFV